MKKFSMVIPTLERSLDLLVDNDFALSDEEIDQLYQLLMNDEEIFSNINLLVNSIDPNTIEMDKLKTAFKNLLHKDSPSVELLYEKIIGDKKVISFIQELILKRLID